MDNIPLHNTPAGPSAVNQAFHRLQRAATRFGTGVSVIRDFKNWLDVFQHVTTNKQLKALHRRDGTKIVGAGETQLWNHYNDIWNHRSYTKYFEIPADGVVLDVGANVGVFCLFAARKARLVHAFEPSLTNFEYLVANTRKTPNIVVHNFAIGSANGHATLDVSGSPTSCTLIDNWTPDTASEIVETKTLNTVFKDLGIEHCDYMKLDCEGSEYAILLSVDTTLLGRIDTIVLEFHDHLTNCCSHRDLLQKLRSSGFRASAYNHSTTYGMISAQRLRNGCTLLPGSSSS